MKSTRKEQNSNFPTAIPTRVCANKRPSSNMRIRLPCYGNESLDLFARSFFEKKKGKGREIAPRKYWCSLLPRSARHTLEYVARRSTVCKQLSHLSKTFEHARWHLKFRGGHRRARDGIGRRDAKDLTIRSALFGLFFSASFSFFSSCTFVLCPYLRRNVEMP